MTAAPSSTATFGILCMLAGMFLISINDMLIKQLGGAYPLHQLVFIRSLIAILVTGMMLQMEGGLKLLRTGRPGLHLLRALLIVGANSAMYSAIVALPLATATAIYFVAPLFVTLLSIPVLGERVGPRRFAAIGIGFAGVLLMMGPQLAKGDAGFGWVLILPVIGAACYASMSVLTRKLGATSRASALAIQLHIGFVLVSVVVYFLAGDGRHLSPDHGEALQFLLRPWVWPDPSDYLSIGVLGLISAIVGYLMTQAYRLSRASVVAPFEYMLLIYALIWGWTIFGEWPEPAVFMGAAVIIGAGIYVFLREDSVKRGRRPT
jgi:S-adenosylmethionine uptake transporter